MAHLSTLKFIPYNENKLLKCIVRNLNNILPTIDILQTLKIAL